MLNLNVRKLQDAMPKKQVGKKLVPDGTIASVRMPDGINAQVVLHAGSYNEESLRDIRNALNPRIGVGKGRTLTLFVRNSDYTEEPIEVPVRVVR